MLKIRNLTKRYGRHTALDSLDLQIDRGEIFGFVGPNGAGKTTTMKIMAGLLKADAGEIYIDDIKLFEDYNRLKEVIGYMPDFFGVYDNLQVMEYLEFYASAYGMETRQARRLGGHLLEMVHLEGKEECYVDELSRGMKQRLCLARALTMDPDVLIVSEPTRGIDIGAKKLVLEYLTKINREMGKTIIVVSSELVELRSVCDRIAIISDGKLASIMSPDAPDAEFGLAMSGSKAEGGN